MSITISLASALRYFLVRGCMHACMHACMRETVAETVLRAVLCCAVDIRRFVVELDDGVMLAIKPENLRAL